MDGSKSEPLLNSWIAFMGHVPSRSHFYSLMLISVKHSWLLVYDVGAGCREEQQ